MKHGFPVLGVFILNSPATDQTKDNGDDCQHQKNMDKASNAVKKHSQQPSDDQNNCDEIQ
jgi:hypothetical protein